MVGVAMDKAFAGLLFGGAVLLACVAGDSLGTTAQDRIFRHNFEAAVCGNGYIDNGETCDDSNAVDGDGCSAQCQIDQGYQCFGEPSVCLSTCGDGLIAPGAGEECDDGNAADGDGCSKVCKIEPGFLCSGSPSVCMAICGDGMAVGGETCDDGNAAGGDGCSAQCQIETGYQCSGTPSACAPVCGDGIRVGDETCDDGNTVDGDGCSPQCQIDPGFTCHGTPSVCTSACGDGLIAPGEECDDGNVTNNDGCSFCKVDPGYSCVGQPSVCAPFSCPATGSATTATSGSMRLADSAWSIPADLIERELGHKCAAPDILLPHTHGPGAIQPIDADASAL